MSEALKIRALIVDDEKPHRNDIMQALKGHPEVEVVGECSDGYQAIAAIREHAPDLVFLDVRMPEVSGFDVLQSLTLEALPLVIFVTGFEKYAVKSFEFSPIDFLLKPFDQERFDKALQKAKHTLATQKRDELTAHMLTLIERWSIELKPQSQPLERISIPMGKRELLVKTKDIDWIEVVEHKHTLIHVGPKTFVSPKPIGVLEAWLDPKRFVRVNRSFIVNINFVEGIIHPSDEEGCRKEGYKVALKNGMTLNLSASGREKIKKLLGNDS